MDFCELNIKLKLRSMATTSLLILLPDSSWKNSYEFSKINRTLKLTWAELLLRASSFGPLFSFGRRIFRLPKELRRPRMPSALAASHAACITRTRCWLPRTHAARCPRMHAALLSPLRCRGCTQCMLLHALLGCGPGWMHG